MGTAHSHPRRDELHVKPQPPRRDDEQFDVTALVEENAQLRELVIQLSKLVIKGVVDRK